MQSDDVDSFIDHDDDDAMFEQTYEEDMPLDALEEVGGELAVDVYSVTGAIIVKCMTAGVRKGDLDVSITRESITIRGHRDDDMAVMDDRYYHRELYWGPFSRTIILPEEIDVEEAEATEEHGLLTIVLPLIDKNKEAKLKVK